MTRQVQALLVAVFLLQPIAVFASPNIVLISIDTLRADHLSMYGYGVPTTPFLSQLAARGLLFERGSVVLPNTTPSHATMLTGQSPSRHGSIGLWVPMKRSVDTIAAALRRRGYYTAGSVAVSHIGRAFNFDRGFVDFAQPAEGVTERDANAVNQDALRFLAARPADRNEPFFLFVHYFDCHAPYGWRHVDQTDAATLPLAW